MLEDGEEDAAGAVNSGEGVKAAAVARSDSRIRAKYVILEFGICRRVIWIWKMESDVQRSITSLRREWWIEEG
jgi:hypothetical protein